MYSISVYLITLSYIKLLIFLLTLQTDFAWCLRVFKKAVQMFLLGSSWASPSSVLSAFSILQRMDVKCEIAQSQIRTVCVFK